MKLLNQCLAIALLMVSLSVYAVTPLQLNNDTQIVFASVEQGQKILSTHDDFLSRLSPFDRSARLQTDQATDVATYLAHVKQQVKPWQDKDRLMLKQHFKVIGQQLERFSVVLPKQISFIKTTGNEEGNPSGYTRGNAIILTEKGLSGDKGTLRHLLLHEFFHVLSRSNPALKRKLYQVIGFHSAKELIFPQSLHQRKITNPDAPVNDHFIKVSYQGKQQKVVPILFAKEGGYDVSKGGPFFRYLDFQLLVVEHNELTGAMRALKHQGKLQLLSPQKVQDFARQIGANTGYVIHPEEVLADNFAHLLNDKQGLPNPEILQAIKRVLSSH